MDVLFAFLDQPPPLSPLLASYTSRVAQAMLSRRTSEVLPYISLFIVHTTTPQAFHILTLTKAHVPFKLFTFTHHVLYPYNSAHFRSSDNLLSLRPALTSPVAFRILIFVSDFSIYQEATRHYRQIYQSLRYVSLFQLTPRILILSLPCTSGFAALSSYVSDPN
jgi:hypothetical protein